MKYLLSIFLIGLSVGPSRSSRLVPPSLSVRTRTFSSRSGGRIPPEGEDTEYGEFPHQVALLHGGGHMCGGSIVAANYVLTAGHCCDGFSSSSLEVRAGSWHLQEEDEDQVDYPVKSIRLHEDYDSWTIANDICLVEVVGSIVFNDHVNEIALPPAGEEYECGTMCWVTGWGEVLKKTQVPIVCDDECRKAYEENDITDSMMCTGSAGVYGQIFCQGNSGGPLMCGADPMDEISGIISWGYGCGDERYPDVLTQVSYYVNWINEHI